MSETDSTYVIPCPLSDPPAMCELGAKRWKAIRGCSCEVGGSSSSFSTAGVLAPAPVQRARYLHRICRCCANVEWRMANEVRRAGMTCVGVGMLDVRR
jgi:hypothetical protein